MFKFVQTATRPLLTLPRLVKRLVVLAVDMSLCVLTVWLAYYLRLGEWIVFSANSVWLPLVAVFVSLITAIPIFIVSGFYRAIFRYSGLAALMSVIKAIGTYAVIYASVFTVYGVSGVPRTIGLIQPILLLIAVGTSRGLARYWLGDAYHDQLKLNQTARVLIYGAGSAGRQLAAAMSNNTAMKIVGFLDDDSTLHGQLLNSLRIYDPRDLPSLASSLGVSDVLLALPSTNRRRKSEILEQMRQAKVAVRTLPSLTELAQGKVTTTDIRELDIDELLGREVVSPDFTLMERNITDKIVLVTGAGGSIGSELCRQILYVRPRVLLLIEQHEYALYSVHQELSLKALSRTAKIIPLLASVRDEDRLREILTAWKPHIIYHAAAYKHVPLVEHNPVEAVKTNIFGTLKIAKIAKETCVKHFVLISTDKAVRPTNIMGATKRVAEMALQALAANEAVAAESTTFSIVRFGNVLGSSGSVVPLFRQQIREGGPVTVTHEGITRYFMSIPEAAQLVIQAGAMATGGDLFLLDMGEPVKIIDLAQRMIELSGLSVRNETNPDGDIEIKIIGLRPGEKLYEELLIGDKPNLTKHPKIMMALEEFIPWPTFDRQMSEIQNAITMSNMKQIRLSLEQLVAGYNSDYEVVDWVTTQTKLT